jgi:hypothetical protein
LPFLLDLLITWRAAAALQAEPIAVHEHQSANALLIGI